MVFGVGQFLFKLFTFYCVENLVDFSKLLWTKILLAISVNKGRCSHQAITLQPPGWWILREPRIRKHRMLAPDSWGAYQRNDFREPRILHLPTHREALNSLTWDIWSSFINSKPLIFWVPGLLLQNSYISYLPLCPFGAISQNYLCAVSQA